MSLRKVSYNLQGLRFFGIFEKSGKNEATDLAVSQLRLRGSTRYDLCPCARPAHVGECGTGPSSSSPKQWKSFGCVKIYNSVSARSPLTKSKKNYRERKKL